MKRVEYNARRKVVQRLGNVQYHSNNESNTEHCVGMLLGQITPRHGVGTFTPNRRRYSEQAQFPRETKPGHLTQQLIFTVPICQQGLTPAPLLALAEPEQVGSKLRVSWPLTPYNDPSLPVAHRE